MVKKKAPVQRTTRNRSGKQKNPVESEEEDEEKEESEEEPNEEEEEENEEDAGEEESDDAPEGEIEDEDIDNANNTVTHDGTESLTTHHTHHTGMDVFAGSMIPDKNSSERVVRNHVKNHLFRYVSTGSTIYEKDGILTLFMCVWYRLSL